MSMPSRADDSFLPNYASCSFERDMKRRVNALSGWWLISTNEAKASFIYKHFVSMPSRADDSFLRQILLWNLLKLMGVNALSGWWLISTPSVSPSATHEDIIVSMPSRADDSFLQKELIWKLTKRPAVSMPSRADDSFLLICSRFRKA